MGEAEHTYRTEMGADILSDGRFRRLLLWSPWATLPRLMLEVRAEPVMVVYWLLPRRNVLHKTYRYPPRDEDAIQGVGRGDQLGIALEFESSRSRDALETIMRRVARRARLDLCHVVKGATHGRFSCEWRP